MIPENDLTLILALLGLLMGSSVFASVVKNSQIRSMKHKELVAAASQSVYKRVEMYYRIRRRTKDASDVISIRNAFHNVQEENEYYRVLLTTESKWHGERYSLYIKAIQKLTEVQSREAWKQKPFGPDVVISPEDRPDHKKIEKLSMQFAKDSRHLMNPLMNILMCCRDSRLVKFVWKVRAYEP